MEESFELTWEDASNVVQSEEVTICDINEDILSEGNEEYVDSVTEEVTVEEQEVGDPTQNGQESVPIMYLTNEGNVLVMQSTADGAYQEQYMNSIQMGEEVVTEQWVESCPEEIVIGSEEAVGDTEEQQIEEEIPLPTDQDQYTASRPYPCDFCSRRFRKKANLMNHMVAHQTDRPHACNLCGVRYIRKCDLMNHLKTHAFIPEGQMEEEIMEQVMEDGRKRTKPIIKRKKKFRLKEEIPGDYGDESGAGSSKGYSYIEEDVRLMENRGEYVEYVQEEEIERYPVTDPKKPFVCQHCGVGFAREKALASHSRIHAGDSPFECQKCGEMFWEISLMREHARLKHGEMDFLTAVDDDEEDADYSEEDESTKYGTFYCSTCGLSFHRQDNLKRHQRVHVNVKEEFANENEFGHICNVCGESFPEALDLLAHAEVHARGQEHRCMICGEVCSDDNAVAEHVQLQHGKELPPNTCMLCGRTCKDRKTLLKHSWEHSREKLFACSKCAKTFHNKARLKRHMLSHRNKVVACDVCGEEFPDGRSLMNHRHSHSSVSGRQFPCRECGKTFGSRSSQQIHIRIHTGERPYGCRYCWKAFADGGTLRKHERIHTGEKPYACAVCPRAFNQRVVLREHIRSHHSGPDPKYSHSMTPYCCTVCSDMFATSQDLIVHLIHHCDMNTAMKRQPQIGPRKYKRRRKLKPHELELISSRVEDNVDEDMDNRFTEDSDDDRERRKKGKKSIKKSPSSPNLNETYNDIYNSCSTAIENINSIVNAKQTPKKKLKAKSDTPVGPSRPKMIHTQKTKVAVDANEDGKIRHKTKTMVTRTQPVEVRSSTGERIRPRTKNVSYHVLQPEKLPLATFSDEDLTAQAVNNLLKHEPGEKSPTQHQQDMNGLVYMDQVENPPEIASEQTVESDTSVGAAPVPVSLVKVASVKSSRKNNKKQVISGKVIRLVKEGMIVSKNSHKKSKNDENEPETIIPDMIGTKETGANHVHQHMTRSVVKQEMMDQSPLHELAEISMQHAQSLFKCEMCSEVFTDRAQLLVHVPIHI